MRYLRGNKCNRIPKRFVCLDTETHWPAAVGCPDQSLHTWRLGVARFCRMSGTEITEIDELCTTSKVGLWTWVMGKCHPRERLWIFAHNALFDLTISDFWGMVHRKLVLMKKWVISDPPTIVTGAYGLSKFTIVDSMNWCPVSLATLGRWLHLEKEPMPHQSETDDIWFHYCKMDVLILSSFVEHLINLVAVTDLGNFQKTAAAQSMSAFRHRWMKHEICLHESADAKKGERAAYYGGRVACLYVGPIGEAVYHADVNNLYPFVMGNIGLPTKLVRTLEGPDVTTLKRLMDGHCVVAEVGLCAEHKPYPVRTNSGVQWRTGRFWTWLCGAELLDALHHNYVTGCVRAYVYRREPIFQKWSDDWCFWLKHLKDAGRPAIYQLSKVIANALSGKWAQRSRVWTEVHNGLHRQNWGEWWNYSAKQKQWFHLRAVAGTVQVETEQNDWFGSFPAISAHISSAGRMYMDYVRAVCGTRQVWYQDTDGLHCTGLAIERLATAGLLHESEPGKLKHCMIGHNVEILGQRRISVAGQVHQPGLRPSAVQVADGTYLQDAWQGGQSLLASDPVGKVRVAKRRIKLGPARIGGSVGVDGWVEPYSFD